MTERERELQKQGAYTIRGIVGVLIIVAIGVTLAESTTEGTETSPNASRFDNTVFLGGKSLRNISSSFVGGQATAFMGGLELDLREAMIEGDEAVIELFVLMGGVQIQIPENWEVISEFDVLLGGVEDRTRSRSEDATKKLVLRGTVLMGGLDLRN